MQGPCWCVRYFSVVSQYSVVSCTRQYKQSILFCESWTNFWVKGLFSCSRAVLSIPLTIHVKRIREVEWISLSCLLFVWSWKRKDLQCRCPSLQSLIFLYVAHDSLVYSMFLFISLALNRLSFTFFFKLLSSLWSDDGVKKWWRDETGILLWRKNDFVKKEANEIWITVTLERIKKLPESVKQPNLIGNQVRKLSLSFFELHLVLVVHEFGLILHSLSSWSLLFRWKDAKHATHNTERTREPLFTGEMHVIPFTACLWTSFIHASPASPNAFVSF